MSASVSRKRNAEVVTSLDVLGPVPEKSTTPFAKAWDCRDDQEAALKEETVPGLVGTNEERHRQYAAQNDEVKTMVEAMVLRQMIQRLEPHAGRLGFKRNLLAEGIDAAAEAFAARFGEQLDLIRIVRVAQMIATPGFLKVEAPEDGKGTDDKFNFTHFYMLAKFITDMGDEADRAPFEPILGAAVTIIGRFWLGSGTVMQLVAESRKLQFNEQEFCAALKRRKMQ